MFKLTGLHIQKKSLLASVFILPLLVAGIFSVSGISATWAQEAPVVAPEPPVAGMAIVPVDVTAEVPAATTEATSPPVAAVDPATGVPPAPAVAAADDTQTASGTYETLDPAAFAKLEEAMASMGTLRINTVKPENVGTLVFTLWQHSLLQDAKKLFRTRRPSDVEIANAASGSAVEEARPRGIRELSLSGILYRGTDDWIVWLNGARMAPDALAKEVIDIKVTENYIDIKWFDSYTNLIFPIRMRPHQRFNLDTRIFLPGITSDSAAKLQAASTGN